ncbi:MAG: OsmC family protein [Chloroflexi bacterium]|nr:OsmC family protein [Chloroflexota bacterium]
MAAGREKSSTTAQIAMAVGQASEYLGAHPEEARYRDSYARATLEGGLVASVTGPGGERLLTDMPKGIGGTAVAPSPGWFLRAAEASCIASLVAIRAAATGVTIDSLEVEVDSESDDRGILGLDPGIPAGALAVRVVARIRSSGTSDAGLRELVDWAVDHCPVADTVRRAVPVEVDVEVATG